MSIPNILSALFEFVSRSMAALFRCLSKGMVLKDNASLSRFNCEVCCPPRIPGGQCTLRHVFLTFSVLCALPSMSWSLPFSRWLLSSIEITVHSRFSKDVEARCALCVFSRRIVCKGYIKRRQRCSHATSMSLAIFEVRSFTVCMMTFCNLVITD